ncbi:Rap1a/Tai family immunity protein [Labrys sp. KB_33_2]|uniref:Rap1a/Tai family immunity protein n=1 Tax=Labrys sp. KB_33_2 TaxID=3237479 RepID=UPI003F93C445
MRIFSAIFALSTLAAVNAEAAGGGAELSGNALVESCRAFLLQKTSDYFGQGVCVGIMHTVVASQAGVKQQFRSCPPGGSTLRQDAAVIVAFIDKHPERRHEPLLSLAIDAFHEAWPCQN